jgi:5-methylcytosine-specific restriction endonuclease McrA
MRKKRTVSKPKVARTTKTKTPKTRNSETFTESQFWSYIRSALRQKSRFWKPITQCKVNGRRLYKGPNKRQKYEYQCNECKNWFADKHVAVDHIIPCGSLNCSADLPGFVDRLFIEVDGLQLLCSTCHDRKTQQEKENTKLKKNGK